MNLSRYKISTLEKRLDRYKDKLYQEKLREHQRINNYSGCQPARFSFAKSEELERKIRLLKYEIYKRRNATKGIIPSFKEIKQTAEWKDNKTEWLIFWKGKHVCTQPKGDINIVKIRQWYNRNFTQFQMNFEAL
tara:strand:- start:3426 stop:3827 length:402 start_codon:yes stop_codon:yes gene_type:complete